MGSLQEECNIAMNLVFDQFSREDLVIFYKSASEEIVFSDPNWNADFEDPYSQNIVKTAQKKEIKCRIFYFKDSEILKSLDGDENISLKLAYPIGKVRIQIKKEDFPWLRDAKAFYVLGEKFVKESDWRGVGLLNQINRYEIILRKNQ